MVLRDRGKCERSFINSFQNKTPPALTLAKGICLKICSFVRYLTPWDPGVFAFIERFRNIFYRDWSALRCAFPRRVWFAEQEPGCFSRLCYWWFGYSVRWLLVHLVYPIGGFGLNLIDSRVTRTQGKKKHNEYWNQIFSIFKHNQQQPFFNAFFFSLLFPISISCT